MCSNNYFRVVIIGYLFLIESLFGSKIIRTDDLLTSVDILIEQDELLKHHCLSIVDIDETIMVPTDPYSPVAPHQVKIACIQYYLQALWEGISTEMRKDFTLGKVRDIYEKTMNNGEPFELVNKHIPIVISLLKQYGPVLFVTRRPACVCNATLDHFDQCGIDASFKNPIIGLFEERDVDFNEENGCEYPCLLSKEGILFCDLNKKSVCIEAVLRYFRTHGMNLRPIDTVLIIDDEIKHVEDVSSWCDKKSIRSIGLHFAAQPSCIKQVCDWCASAIAKA